MYREDGKVIAVPEEQLPVTLPEDIDFDLPGNPLDNHPTWKYTKCPSTGLNRLEKQILLILLLTSLVFLRFCSPSNLKNPLMTMK